MQKLYPNFYWKKENKFGVDEKAFFEILKYCKDQTLLNLNALAYILVVKF